MKACRSGPLPAANRGGLTRQVDTGAAHAADVKGANVRLADLTGAPGPLTAALRWSDPSGTGEADVAALLLGPSGKVRRDGDFVFYNQPAAEDGAVQLLGKSPTGAGGEDRIVLDLAALPAGVERIALTASRYAGATFGALDDLGLVLFDSAGAALLGFDIRDAGRLAGFCRWPWLRCGV